MNYKRIYDQLIQKRRVTPANLEYQYTQTHHIVPRSIDPSKAKDKNNLVILSFRQHYVAHALLVKITKTEKDKSKYYKMIHAFRAMHKLYNRRQIKCDYISSTLLAKWKEQRIKFIKQSGCYKGEKSNNYNKIMIYNPITKEMKQINKDQQIPEGWQKGKSQNCVRRGQQSFNYGTRWIYNPVTLQQKLIKKEEQLPQGWQYGVSPLKRQKMKQKYSAPTKGKMWIYNIITFQNKLIFKDQKIEQGWQKGRKLYYKQ